MRKSLAGVLAGVTLLSLRPGTVSIAQGEVGCDAPPIAEAQAAAPAECAPVPPASETPATGTPAPEAPAPDTPPADTAVPGTPAPDAPPTEGPATEAPAEAAPVPESAASTPAEATPAPAPEAPPAPSVHVAPATGPAAPAVAVSAQPPTRSTAIKRQRKDRAATAAPKRRATGAPRLTRRSPRRGAAQPSFPTVTVDWTKLDPLGLPAFPAEIASTFPGPSFLLPIYQAAAAQFEVPWQVLAAINEIETNFGANTNVSSAGAVGWMQFMPATWKRWGMDANGDGHSNPHDPVDAIFSAARYLRAAGSLEDLPRAIFAYNHAGWYVEQVSRRATVLGSIPADVLVSLTAGGRRDGDAITRATGSRGLLDPHAEVDGIGRVMLMSDRRLRRHVLRSKRVHIYECGRADIAQGVTDRRVLETLLYLAYKDFEPTVTSLRCGHGHYTKNGSVSHHSSGDAVDIAAINGTPILGHQGSGSITDATVRELLKLGGAMKAAQIITLIAYEGAPNTLAMGDHHDHIHVGFEPVRAIRGNHGAVQLGHRHGRR